MPPLSSIIPVVHNEQQYNKTLPIHRPATTHCARFNVHISGKCSGKIAIKRSTVKLTTNQTERKLQQYDRKTTIWQITVTWNMGRLIFSSHTMSSVSRNPESDMARAPRYTLSGRWRRYVTRNT